MEHLVLRAYAKLNLALKITGVNPQGYHLLDSVMTSVSLCDIIAFRMRNDSKVAVHGPEWLTSNDDNTIMHAVRALSLAGIEGGADIDVVKNIPESAGMGGGSADAAAVLRGLCMLWNKSFEHSVAAHALPGMGADIPFAYMGGMARAQGIGEILYPLTPITDIPILCVKPAAGLLTKQVFDEYDKAPIDSAVDIDAFIKALYARDWFSMNVHGGNDLHQAALSICPEIGDIFEHMDAFGAMYTVMTGSGTTVVGLFQRHEEAVIARNYFHTFGYFAQVVYGVEAS